MAAKEDEIVASFSPIPFSVFNAEAETPRDEHNLTRPTHARARSFSVSSDVEKKGARTDMPWRFAKQRK